MCLQECRGAFGGSSGGGSVCGDLCFCVLVHIWCHVL